jgi:hypothetical protein
MINTVYDCSTAFDKLYNIEWYSGNGKVLTTSATLRMEQNGYSYFTYPNGGLFIVESKVIRSMQCIEE